MESFSGETDGSTEDIPGKKKSKLKILKSRLFGRSKRAGGQSNAKLSQSSGDITAREGLGSDEDLACSQGTLGSRAMSHDSIFLADQVMIDAKTPRVSSQESVQSNIKALQMKLQQQKLHLGPPPRVLPVRRSEDPASCSDDEPLTMSCAKTLATTQSSHGPCPPNPKPTPTKSAPPNSGGSFISYTSPAPKPAPVATGTFISYISPAPVVEPASRTSGTFISYISPANVDEIPLDLGSPPKLNTCLDTSAARHRMSVKPRNQRASTKGKRQPTAEFYTIDHIVHAVSEKEEDQNCSAVEEAAHSHSTQIVESGQGEATGTVTSQRIPLKPPETAPITSEPSKAQPGNEPLCPPYTHQEIGTYSRSVTDVRSTEQPLPDEKGHGDVSPRRHSSDALKSNETISKTSAGVPIPSTLPHTSTAPLAASKLSSVRHQGQSVVQRSGPGSGSFHFSVTPARGRSSSFVGPVGRTEPKVNRDNKAENVSLSSTTKEKKLQTREGIKATDENPSAALTIAGSALNKTWDQGKELSRSAPTNSGVLMGIEATSRQEVAKEETEAEEVTEEKGKTPFGIKLRSTSLSKKLRSDPEMASRTAAASPYILNPKAASPKEQTDKHKEQETGNASKYAPVNISVTPTASTELKDGTPTSSGSSQPEQSKPPAAADPHTSATQVPNTTVNKDPTAPLVTKESQAASQTASTEVSWMSLAMEKTRSLQQLLTSRFPRDATGTGQPHRQPVTQAPTVSSLQKVAQSEVLIDTQTQAAGTKQSPTQQAAPHPSSDTIPQRGGDIRTAEVSAKSSPPQQKPSVPPKNLPTVSKEPKQSKDTSSKSNLTPLVTQSPAHSAPRADAKPQPGQGSLATSLAQYYVSSALHAKPSPVSRSNQEIQIKTTTSSSSPESNTAQTSNPLPAASAAVRGTRGAIIQRNKGPTLSERRAIFDVPVVEKSSVKQAEVTTATSAKETRTPAETPASVSATPLIKDTEQEERQGVKLKESSPTKPLDKAVSREDKWLRKNVTSSLPPSSSATLQSPLRSISDSGQPSWMELAKRKSMAWNDKNMD